MRKRIFAWLLTVVLILSSLSLPSTAVALVGDSLEAENAVKLGGAGFASDHGGYTGTGFVAGLSAAGSGMTFENINAQEPGYYSLRIRYANGNGGGGNDGLRKLSVYTNDNTANPRQLDFPRTYGWNDNGFGVWGYVYTNVYLQEGNNTITIAYLDGDTGSINIDNISVASSLLTTKEVSGIVNAGFDTGNTDGWTLSDASGTGVDNGGTSRGTHKFYIWANNYQKRISQTVTGLENGTYLVSLFAKVYGDNDPNVCRLELKDYDGTNETYKTLEKRANNEARYERYEQEVVVKDGKLSIGVYADAPTGNNIAVNLDDFQLYQVIDKNSLNDAIKTASTLEESNYTSGSWGAFQTALTSAGNVLNNTDATQTQIDGAKNDLITAQTDLQEAAGDFTVSAAAVANGSITPATRSVVTGGTASFVITPSDGYMIDAVTVSPETAYILTGTNLTITNVQSDLQINVTFKQTQEAIDQAAADHVKALISAIGLVTVNSGDAIMAAEAAYADLTSQTQRDLVTNYNVLIAARMEYDLLTDPEVLLDLDFSKYTGDGTAAAAITDNSGHLTTLSSSALQAETVSGKKGIRFTGSNQDANLIHWSASTYDPFSQISEGVTLSMWINAQNKTNWGHIFNYATGKNYVDNTGDVGYTGNYLIMQNTGSGNGHDNDLLRTAMNADKGTVSENYSGSWDNYMNRWTLLTFTQDTETKEVNIYQNGVKIATFVSTYSLYEISNKVNAASEGAKSVNYFLGGPQLNLWESDPGMDAVVSRFTIYNKAFTAEEVADLYNPDQQNADYTAVNNAIDAAQAAIALGIYTDVSVAALQAAINAVNWNKTVSEQAAVDAMATAIVNATSALVKKQVSPDAVMQKLTYTDEDGTVLPYRLYVPDDYDSSKDYPVLLVLHGAGERGTDNQKQINSNVGIINRIINSDNPDYDCIIVSPQCADNSQWVDTPWSNGSYDQSKISISKYLKATTSLLTKIKSTFSVDNKRLYITGLSMGGYGTWDIITRYPKMFAAAIPLCGAGDPTKAEAIKDMPIWVFHGSADGIVPVKGSQDMVNALRALNSKVKYTEYPGVGHNCWENAYAETDLISWMFAQSKPEPSLTSVEVTSLPTKTVYTEGENFDPAGMVVTAHYDDNSTEIVIGYTLSGYTSTPGTKTITVTYGDKTDTFEVTVNVHIILGDVDLDGEVNVTDVVMLRQLIMSGKYTEKQFAAGNLDNDEKLTVTDVVALRSLIIRGTP